MKKSALYLTLTVFVVFLLAAGAFGDTVSGTGGDGWQSWGTGNLDENGSPYWDHTSFDGSHYNVGYFLTNTGAFNPVTGTDPLKGTGPGVVFQYWGAAGGGSDPNFFFQKTPDTGDQAAIKLEVTNFKLANPFGWFETDATGTTIGTLHEMFSGPETVGATESFTPTTYYGYYLTDERGTFYTLSSHDSPWNQTTFFQHFVVFKENANTNWIAVEDLITNPGGREDRDYNDLVVKITSIPIPEPGAMLVLGSGLLGLVGLRRKFRK